MEVGDPHWAALHDAVYEARECTLKALGSMAAVDEDKSLSLTGKAEKKREIATKAITALSKSPRLVKARSAVEVQVERCNEKLGLTPKAPEGVGAAMIAAEVRAHLAAMKPAERLAFVDAHASEVGDAVLSAPAFLSGLTPAELGVVKHRIEQRTDPAAAAAKAEALAALAELERGWRNAFNQIRECGGLEKPFDGAEKVAQRAGTSMSV